MKFSLDQLLESVSTNPILSGLCKKSGVLKSVTSGMDKIKNYTSQAKSLLPKSASGLLDKLGI